MGREESDKAAKRTIIREGCLADIPELVDFSIAFVYRMPGPSRIPDRDAIEAYFCKFMVSDQSVFFVSDRGGRLSGLICGFIAEDPFTGKSAVLKSSWIVDPDARGDGVSLLRRFEAWASEVGAERCIIAHMYGDDTVGKLLTRRGYVPTETSYERLA